MNTVKGKGSYNVICDVCGFKIKSTEALKRWDGLIVCPDDYEERHITDFFRTRRDQFPIPFSRPEPADVYINANTATDRAWNGSALNLLDMN
jgi:hypothetical protein